MSSFYELTSLDINNQPYPFSQLKGKVVLIVNVASKCWFTSQYSELESLYQKYKDKNFIILGFPCNQFASQEPKSNEEINSFCSTTYNVTFPIMSKICVNGDQTDPVYKFLKSQKSLVFKINKIFWNFEKFLINRDGEVVERFSFFKNPSSLSEKIESLLK